MTASELPAWVPPATAAAGRALIALLFVLAGVAKALGPRPFLAHMDQFRIPRVLIAPVIALEITGGCALLTGVGASYAAPALALFCLATALVFHRNLTDKAERTLFFKDLAIAGGLLVLTAAQPLSGL